jgi:predicted transcriptional regulator
MSLIDYRALKNAREGQFYSISELALKAGVDRDVVRRVERGLAARPSAIRKIIKALGYDPKERPFIVEGDDGYFSGDE